MHMKTTLLTLDNHEQNPPSIPTLLLAQLSTAYISRSRLIIDWHNLGYSILALKLGDGHPLVHLAKWFALCLI